MKRNHNKIQGKSRSQIVLGITIVLALLTNGCLVGKKKYEAAVQDMESAKMDLEKSRMMREALEQENNNLRNENEKVALDLEVLASEVQRIKEGQASEKDILAIREVEIEKKSKALSEKMAQVQQKYQKIKSQNRALRDTVHRYQAELKEARETRAASVEKVPVLVAPKASSVSPKTTLPKSASIAKLSSVENPLKNTLVPVNINTASANDLVLFLGLPKDTAEKIVVNRPYRLRGELVAKQVLPKATFDVIKDRITALTN